MTNGYYRTHGIRKHKEVVMKQSIVSVLAIALIALSLAGCLTLKPFSQAELDQISGHRTSSQGK